MNEQISLFDMDGFEVYEKEKRESYDYLICFRSEMQEKKKFTMKELFSGFNSIRVITFSYNLGFINEIMKDFAYGEILIGANFLLQRDAKMNDFMAEVLTDSKMIGPMIKKYDRLYEMFQNGDIEFHTPLDIIDHRKIYLLSADDGRTRVITGSANMDRAAWSGDHMEFYEYDDTDLKYEECKAYFDTAWDNSQEVPLSVLSSKKSDDLVEGNPILKGVKDTGKTIVLKQAEDEMVVEDVKFTLDHERIKEEYKEIIKNINKRSQKGIFEINPETVEKITKAGKKIKNKKVHINNKTEGYPEMTFDIESGSFFLNGKQIDLQPSKEDVRGDIESIIKIYENFDVFVGNTENLKQTHFKLMNAIFCSPFFAKIRCFENLHSIATSSLPLFALISSEHSNSGKTFMIRAALKLMTGKELKGVSACDYNKDKIREAQIGVKVTPFFIDEIDNAYFSRIKDIIKNPEKCEEEMLETMPMLLFASNNVLKPNDYLRKRMLFFEAESALPSTIDHTEFGTRGIHIIKKLGTSFYREYLRRMMERINKEFEYIENNELLEGFYIDIFSISSKIFLEILNDYEFDVPSYMRELRWNDDYSSECNARNVVSEIGKFCRNNKKTVQLSKDTVTIELGSDKDSQNLLRSWFNMLPAEVNSTVQTTRDYSKIIINRIELETKLGYRLSKFSLFGR